MDKFEFEGYRAKDKVTLAIFRKNIDIALVRNPGRDISFPIFIRKELETRKLERKLKQ